MIFNSKNKNRTALKSRLLDEAKKERYKLQLLGHIKELQLKHDKYNKMAINGKKSNDKQSMDLGIKQSLLIQNHIDKLKGLVGYIDKLETESNVKDLYDEFFEHLVEFTEEFKEKKSKKRKTKKALKTHRKEVEQVNDYFQLIDKRIEKINKSMQKNITDTKPLSEKEVNNYFNDEAL